MKRLLQIISIIYSINSDTCGSLVDKRCAGCNENKECAFCFRSYWDKNTKSCIFSNKIQYCKRYESEKKCIDCDKGYFLLNNKCEKLEVKNCAVSNKERGIKKCFICFNKKLIDYGGIGCSENFCLIDNCIYCSHLWKHPNFYEACFGCATNYSLSPDLRDCYKTEGLNCYVTKLDGSCNVCKYGYYMNNGVCIDSDLFDDKGIYVSSFKQLFFKVFFLLSFFL